MNPFGQLNPDAGRALRGPARRVVFGAVGMAVAITGCGGGDGGASDATATGFPLSVSDCSRDIELTERPESVLTVGVSAAALLHAAGAADTIVARTGEFGAELPAELDAAIGDVEIIDDFDPTLEAIVGADPDLVLGYGLFSTEAADVEAAGVATLTVTGECGHAALPAEKSDAGNFAVMIDDIRTYGRIFGTEETAEAAATDLEARVEAVRSDPPVTDGTTAAGVYFFGEQLSVTGRHNMVHEQMTALGLTDVYEDLDEAFAEISIESLLDADPDVILLSYGFAGDDFEMAKENLLAQPGASDLRAVADDRIIGLPSTLRGPDPGAVEGLELLAAELAG